MLKKLRGRLFRVMEDFPPDDVVARMSVLERDLREIRDIQDGYCDAVDDYIDDYSSELEQDPEQARQWDLDKRNVRAQVMPDEVWEEVGDEEISKAAGSYY